MKEEATGKDSVLLVFKAACFGSPLSCAIGTRVKEWNTSATRYFQLFVMMLILVYLLRERKDGTGGL